MCKVINLLLLLSSNYRKQVIILCASEKVATGIAASAILPILCHFDTLSWLLRWWRFFDNCRLHVSDFPRYSLPHHLPWQDIILLIFLIVVLYLICTVIHERVRARAADLIWLPHLIETASLHGLLLTRVHLTDVRSNELFVVQFLFIVLLIRLQQYLTITDHIKMGILTFSRSPG